MSWIHGRTSGPTAGRVFAAAACRAHPRRRRAGVFGLLLVCLLLGLVASCTRQPQGTPGAESAKSPQVKPEVVLHPASGAPASVVQVELARTPEEQARGLMYRLELSPSAGMLFLFDRADIRRFWMKNTLIPLDMIFFDANRQVVGIEENTTPHDETARGPDAPAQFVLEVVGGYSRRHGIGIGSRADFVHVD